jgi:hypothetical protein
MTYHLKPLLHRSCTLQVLSGGLNVEVDLLLTQIDHVAREERLAMLLEVLLVGIEEPIQPGKKLLGTMIGVENDWNAVGRSDGTYVHRTSNATSN